MAAILNLIQLDHIPIFEQLQIEEALLRADSENWCLINYGSPPAIVMGISAKIPEVVDLSYLKKKPIPLIRRFSGGGTVVIDPHSFFVTFICSTSFIPIEPFPHSIMRWTESFYRPLFENEPFALRENDYVLGDKKFGGNAQSIIKNRWLHHSSLLWNFCPNRMNYLQLPKKRPIYRDERDHHEFLCTLQHRWESLEAMQESFVNRLQEMFAIQKISHEDLKSILDRPHRKTTQFI